MQYIIQYTSIKFSDIFNQIKCSDKIQLKRWENFIYLHENLKLVAKFTIKLK